MVTSQKAHAVAPQILIALGLALIVLVGMTMAVAEPENDSEAAEQITYRNHDIAGISAYESAYVGDSVNTVELLYSLPLGERIERVEIHETDVVVTLLDAPNIDQFAERDDALYSAIAFMASVDNATSVTYESPDYEYSVSRNDVEDRFNAPLSGLLDSPDDWRRVRTLVPIESDSLVS
ncbi:DUF4825 domain-containing protein [Trueperella bialowiezensis]|uniref:DUF4825 domain-containing protein n=1 Tax=Trueperella bialowiezensis TaxID=312285 RepID=A0A3S4VG02_9ACTO|nr:DUF4825 domain-containing protein [Trueperella bialowiezensis]VEI13292.1 Uncharacterised protein [Trueperella bialowiezensis]